MRRYALIALLLTALFTLSVPVIGMAQINRISPVKCERPSAEYLKEAEKLQKEAISTNQRVNPSRASQLSVSVMALLKFYEVYFGRKKN